MFDVVGEVGVAGRLLEPDCGVMFSTCGDWGHGVEGMRYSRIAGVVFVTDDTEGAHSLSSVSLSASISSISLVSLCSLVYTLCSLFSLLVRIWMDSKALCNEFCSLSFSCWRVM